MEDFTPNTENIRAAANDIESNGWWNGRGPSYLKQCAATALFSEDDREGFARWLGIRNADNGIYYTSAFRDIVTWNDAQTSGEVVIAKLREYADSLDSPPVV